MHVLSLQRVFHLQMESISDVEFTCSIVIGKGDESARDDKMHETKSLHQGEKSSSTNYCAIFKHVGNDTTVGSHYPPQTLFSWSHYTVDAPTPRRRHLTAVVLRAFGLESFVGYKAGQKGSKTILQ